MQEVKEKVKISKWAFENLIQRWYFFWYKNKIKGKQIFFRTKDLEPKINKNGNQSFWVRKVIQWKSLKWEQRKDAQRKKYKPKKD